MNIAFESKCLLDKCGSDQTAFRIIEGVLGCPETVSGCGHAQHTHLLRGCENNWILALGGWLGSLAQTKSAGQYKPLNSFSTLSSNPSRPSSESFSNPSLYTLRDDFFSVHRAGRALNYATNNIMGCYRRIRDACLHHSRVSSGCQALWSSPGPPGRHVRGFWTR